MTAPDVARFVNCNIVARQTEVSFLGLLFLTIDEAQLEEPPAHLHDASTLLVLVLTHCSWHADPPFVTSKNYWARRLSFYHIILLELETFTLSL